MPEDLHPGVYVSEVPVGTHTIQAASTSTACFIGETARGRPFAPGLVTSFTEFSRVFGDLGSGSGKPPPDLPLAARQFFENGGTRLYVVRVVAADATVATGSIHGKIAIEALGPGAWGNDLRVVLSQSAVDPTRVDVAVQLKSGDDTYVGVESYAALGFDPTKPKFYATILNRDSNHLRVLSENGQYYEVSTAGVVSDLGLTVPKGHTTATTQLDLSGGSDGTGTALTPQSLEAATGSLERYRDVSILALPGVFQDDLLIGIRDWVRREDRRDMILILDGPGDHRNSVPRDTQLADVQAYQKSVTNDSFCALYWPWVEVPDPLSSETGATRFAPPSGFIAGLYARTDHTRGVWKAPAGVDATILGAVGLAVQVTEAEQSTLNPVGINCLRRFDSAGIVCWGARTQAPQGSDMVYVPVRRTEICLRKSLVEGTQWSVFEPNDAPLWRSITDSIDAFLQVQFRSGAFQGSSPKDAYFVICDRTNNNQATIDAGQVHITVGFAPLKPAEFVIIDFMQNHQET